MSAKSIGYAIGWALLRKALSFLLTAEVLSAIRAGVAAMMSSDLPGKEKHRAVVEIATTVRDRVDKAGSSEAVELIEIATKAAYLEIVEKPS